MDLNAWPALLTATIKPNPMALAELNDEYERMQHYINVLTWMIKAKTSITKLIFCENSGYDLSSFEKLSVKYSKMRKNIEIYNVPMPQITKFPGKGWGEGIILKWALNNVKSFDRYTSFVKISGRYRIINLNRVNIIIRKSLRRHPELKFICSGYSISKRPFASTEFFWSDRNFYSDYMIDLYERVNDPEGTYLEHVFGERLLQLSNRFLIGILPFPLIIDGFSGWNSKPIMSRKTIMKQKIKQAFTLFSDVKLLSDMNLYLH